MYYRCEFQDGVTITKQECGTTQVKTFIVTTRRLSVALATKSLLDSVVSYHQLNITTCEILFFQSLDRTSLVNPQLNTKLKHKLTMNK